jgi:hypothetical protein
MTCPLTTTVAPSRSSLSVAAAADSDAVPSEALASSTPASSSSAPLAFHEEWKLLWARFLQQAYELGHFAADPGVKPDLLDSNAGAAVLLLLATARYVAIASLLCYPAHVRRRAPGLAMSSAAIPNIWYIRYLATRCAVWHLIE